MKEKWNLKHTITSFKKLQKILLLFKHLHVSVFLILMGFYKIFIELYNVGYVHQYTIAIMEQCIIYICNYNIKFIF